jgi:hypothetical protein
MLSFASYQINKLRFNSLFSLNHYRQAFLPVLNDHNDISFLLLQISKGSKTYAD